MQTFLASVSAVVLVGALWLLRRPVKPMLSSTDAGEVARLNRAQLSLVLEPEAEGSGASDQEAPLWQPPADARESRLLLICLRAAMAEGPEQRLEAVTIAGLWGHRSVLPLLRRALHDSDSRVVAAAAAAISPLRGASHPGSVQASRPPRNIARMR